MTDYYLCSKTKHVHIFEFRNELTYKHGENRVPTD